MKVKNIQFLLILFILLFSCSQKKILIIKQKPVSTHADYDKAYHYFLNGALFDFQNQYEKGLIEYFQALLYDSSSVQILKAIARDFMRLQKNESAIQYLKKAHHLDSTNMEILNYLGEAYYNNKDYQNSTFFFERLLDLDPNNLSAQNNLLYLYGQLKDGKRFLDFYKRMMEAYPSDVKRSLQYSIYAIKQKEYEEAKRVLTKVVENDSSQLNAYFILGNLYETNKDTTTAINIYRKILKQEPYYSDVLSHLYRLYRVKKDWIGLEETYKPLIMANNGTNSQARLILAEAYYYQEKSQQALPILEPVLEDESFRPAALELLGRISFDEENFPEAERYFSLLTKERSENRFGWIFLGILYNRLNKYHESVKTLQDALNIHKKDAGILSLYGSTLNQMGREKEAIEPLEKALALEPDDINTISSLAAVFDKLQMWEKSDSLYENALQKNPDNSLLLNNYSYSLCVRGVQFERALEMAQKALKAEPDNGAYLDTIGWIFYKIGEYEKARLYIEKAYQKNEDNPEVTEHLGDVYYKLKQLDNAREFWKKALELNSPNNTKLKQKIENL
jgi:tetratricopeptide (TPR) repeat protein